MKNDTTIQSDYFFLGLQIGGGESVLNSTSEKSNLYLKDKNNKDTTKVTNNEN